jgi:hypothetical protein
VPADKSEQSFVRIEFQAAPDFIDLLDRARKKRGLSRSAYLRQAALLLAQEDLKDEPKGRKRKSDTGD